MLWLNTFWVLIRHFSYINHIVFTIALQGGKIPSMQSVCLQNRTPLRHCAQLKTFLRLLCRDAWSVKEVTGKECWESSLKGAYPAGRPHCFFSHSPSFLLKI